MKLFTSVHKGYRFVRERLWLLRQLLFCCRKCFFSPHFTSAFMWSTGQRVIVDEKEKDIFGKKLVYGRMSPVANLDAMIQLTELFSKELDSVFKGRRDYFTWEGHLTKLVVPVKYFGEFED